MFIPVDPPPIHGICLDMSASTKPQKSNKAQLANAIISAIFRPRQGQGAAVRHCVDKISVQISRANRTATRPIQRRRDASSTRTDIDAARAAVFGVPHWGIARPAGQPAAFVRKFSPAARGLHAPHSAAP
jgi:hypothetical protein